MDGRTYFCYLFVFLMCSSEIVLAQFRMGAVSQNYNECACNKKRSDGVCSDFIAITDANNLTIPERVQHKWNPMTVFGVSTAVTQRINYVLQWSVPGLGGQTVQDVIKELQKNGCLSFFFGEFLQNQLLGIITTDMIDFESNCDVDTLYHICLDRWGSSMCSFMNGCSVVYIGDDKGMHGETCITDFTNWNGDGTSLQYTTNSIVYFANVIIDITGHGVSDTCNKVIRIPAATEFWELWASPEKLFNYWRLHLIGYKAADVDTKFYIISKTKTFAKETPQYFQAFYCTAVLSGQLKNSTCTIPSELCSGALSQKKEYDNIFEADLGTFWNETMKPLVDGLELSSCSTVLKGHVSDSALLVTNGAQFLFFLSFMMVVPLE